MRWEAVVYIECAKNKKKHVDEQQKP